MNQFYIHNQIDNLIYPQSVALSDLPSALDLSDAASATLDLTSGTPPMALLAAGAAGILGVAAAIFANASGGAKETVKAEPEPEPEPIDVSIPYNAAAVLAYEKAGSPGDFATFEAKYIDATVAAVTLKKKQRDLALFEAEVAKKEAALMEA